jgi:hypothetical protein
MIENANILSRHFPDARVQVYVANDVPSEILRQLSEIPRVRIVHVSRKKGILNMFDRFTAIDDPDCSLMFVRDADSRPHARDIACIEDFIQSDKMLHIIRDHYWHGFIHIPGGLWGIRKAAMKGTMAANIHRWLNRRQMPASVLGMQGMQGPRLPPQCDQLFLRDVLYPRLKGNALIHDRIGTLEGEVRTPFRVPIEDRLFCGQVHRYDASGNEFTEFDP